MIIRMTIGALARLMKRTLPPFGALAGRGLIMGTLFAVLLPTAALAQVAVPGTIQAQDYDHMDGIQTENTSDTGGGQNVGWIDTGDWLLYEVDVAASGLYTLEYRVASPNSSGSVILGQNGSDLTDATPIPNTGGWQNWTTLETEVHLEAGQQHLVVWAETGGWNLNWFRLTGPVDSGQGAPVPGTVQAQDYEAMSGIQTEATSDDGGGENVGWIDAGDWMSYAVNVSSAGWYDVEYRVASLNGGGSVILGQDGQDLGEPLAVPTTGGWQNWTTIQTTVFLEAGAQSLLVYAQSGGWNLNWIRFSAGEDPGGHVNTLPLLQTDGHLWVDEDGNRVDLVGTNIGNWLQLEFWMMNLGHQFYDQCSLEDNLTQRFGHAEKERLMRVFRDSWITERDWDLMAEFGLNVVRLPFWYNLVEDENNPYTLRDDAWDYLDYAIDEAEKRGMYTILDLHGAVGSQGWEHHSGCAGMNELWDSAEYRDRTRWLWDMIASRYAGRNAVAGYGLLNEPWGTDAHTLADFMTELYHVVRAKDPDRIVILPGHDSGIHAYGHPSDRGMDTNVAFEMHFYPGLFGWGQQNYQVHNDWLFCGGTGQGGVCEWQDRITDLDTPFLVGEFQPWTISGAQGGPLTALTVNVYRNMGWASTNWAYKTVSASGISGDGSQSWPWGMVTNSSDGGAMPSINLASASASQIENFFRSFATQPLIANEAVKSWMAMENNAPGRIEAQHFSWQSGVQSEPTSDTQGGINIGWIDTGDWLSYTVDVAVSGWYTVELRVASAVGGGQVILGQDGQDLTAALTVPNTGGWQNWTSIHAPAVYLEAGQRDLVVWAESGGWNFNWFALHLQ